MIRGRDGMQVASWTGSFLDWEQELKSFKTWLAPVFPRQELRETSGHFLDGLLSGIERKTGWLMAEQAGFERPYRMQSLLSFVLADAVYGSDSRLRRMLEDRGQPYVLAVRSNHCLRFIGED